MYRLSTMGGTDQRIGATVIDREQSAPKSG